ALRVETVRRIRPGQWHHVAVTYDGTRLAKSVRVFIDGQPEATVTLLDELNQTFANKEPLRIGSGGGPASRFHGRIADVNVFGVALTADEIAWLADERPIQSASQGKRWAYFLNHGAPAEIRRVNADLFELRLSRQALVDSFPTT